MKFLSYLIPTVAVIAPVLAADVYAESCVNKAVAATQCLASNNDCVCDSPVFLESLFDCELTSGSDDDAAIDAAENFCGALDKRSEDSNIEARANGERRRAIKAQIKVIHQIREQLKKTSGRQARLPLFRKLRRARGKLDKIWGDGEKHMGWGRKLTKPPKHAHPGRPTGTRPPKHAHPGRPTGTRPSHHSQTVIPY